MAPSDPLSYAVLRAPASPRAARPRHLLWLSLLLIGLGLLRGVWMVSADPLVALANNYDQVRYTGCFGLYPLRPGVNPTELNYRAPLRKYAFQSVPGAACYWTSDLLFQATAVGVYRWREAQGKGAAHSVRLLGALRLLAWLIAVLGVTAAFRRDGAEAMALANAAWFAVLGVDPVNAVYFNTFYAEPGVVFFAYLSVALLSLLVLRASWWRGALLVLACAALATSKLQHVLLPLFIAAILLLPALLGRRKLWPAVAATALGGVLGLALQLIQLQQNSVMFGPIALVNNADLALSAVLPSSRDPARTAAKLGLEPACLAHSGKTVYQLDVPLAQACPGAAQLSRGRVLGLLLSEPSTLLGMLARLPSRMLPWIPDYLGLVANSDPLAEPAPLPEGMFSINAGLGKRVWLCWLLLLASPAALLWLIWRRWSGSTTIAFAAACTAIAFSVPCVTVFGDGFTETAKQAHLALNASCALLLVLSVAAIGRRMLGSDARSAAPVGNAQ